MIKDYRLCKFDYCAKSEREHKCNESTWYCIIFFGNTFS